MNCSFLTCYNFFVVNFMGRRYGQFKSRNKTLETKVENIVLNMAIKWFI